jgi:hypothetical protein
MDLVRAAVAACVLLGLTAGTASAAPLTWSAPDLIDHFQPFGTNEGVEAISCVGAELCVGVGDVDVHSTNPADPSVPWSFPQPANGRDVSCATTSLCVAVDTGGAIRATTDPTAAEPTWTEARPAPPFDPANAFVSVSCPSPTFCAAVDASSRVSISTNPGAAPGTWSLGPSLGSNASDLACASATLCVLVFADGNVRISKDPTAATPTWSAATDIGQDLTAVSCPTNAFCMIAAFATKAYRSTDPTAAAPTWTELSTAPASDPGATISLRDISCPTATMCTGVGSASTAVTTTNPGAATPVWRKRSLLPGGLLYTVSCGTTSFCITASNANAFVVNDADEPSPAPTWSPGFQISGFNTLTAAACRGETLCLVTDDVGRVLSTRNPTAPDPDWHMLRPMAARAIAVACPSLSLCVMASDTGQVRITHNADAAAPQWISGPPFGGSLADLECPAVDRCVGIGAGDKAKVLVDVGLVPTIDSPGPTWTLEHQIDGATAVTALSCPSVTHCAVADAANGAVLTATDIGAADPTWDTEPSGAPTLSDISCRAEGLCVAVDPGANAYSSANAFAPAPDWNGPTANVGISVDCPDTAFCAAAYGFDVRISTNAGAAAPTWSPSALLTSGAPSVLTVACADDRLCVAGHYDGHVNLGVAAPQASAGPSVSGAAEVGSTLTATGGTWTGVPAVALHWERCVAAGASCAAVPGAAGSSYAVTADDIGATLRVVETATNAGGTVTAASAATATVPALPFVLVVPVVPGAPIAPGPGGAPPPPDVSALLGRTLEVKGAAAKLGTLVRTGRYTTSYTAPTPGRLVVRWLTIPRRGNRAVLLASARLTFTAAGTKRVVIRLTRKGRKVLRRARRLRITVRATWTPLGGTPVTRSRRVTLRR